MTSEGMMKASGYLIGLFTSLVHKLATRLSPPWSHHRKHWHMLLLMMMMVLMLMRKMVMINTITMITDHYVI